MEDLKSKNISHCKQIALDLEKYANGEIYKCSECGEEFSDNNLFCPGCNIQIDLIEGNHEQLTLYDFFNDIYNVEYRIDSNKEYKSISLMVACGGPNIYVDTASKKVELYWWSDYAEYPLPCTVCESIDDFSEEMYRC